MKPNSLVQIRDFFGAHSDLAQFSTQKGFGELLGRSDAFVRRLEKGVSPMNERVAKLIEAITGVDQTWVMSPEGAPIRAKGGGNYTHLIARKAVGNQIESALRKAGIPAATPNEQLRNLVMEQLNAALVEEEKKGSVELLQALVKIVGLKS